MDKPKDSNIAIKLTDVTKTYRRGGESQDALKNVSFEIKSGESVAIMGPSGSGKSTLLQLIGGLDKPTKGVLEVFGSDVNKLSDSNRSKHRLRTVGFVFQQFYLQPFLSATDNVGLPIRLDGQKAKLARIRSRELLTKVGLNQKMSSRPSQLSGGEMQRVAIARALANNPKIILADEPTGNLDRENADGVIEIFSNLAKEGTTVIVVTHDEKVAAKFRRLIRLENGQIEPGNLKSKSSAKKKGGK